METINNIRIFAVMMVLPLAACTMGNDYQSPQISLPDAWKSLTENSRDKITACENARCTTSADWWQQLNDPVLNELMTRALTNNKDLKIAEGRVREARANRSGAVSPLFPEINATGSAERGNEGLLSNNKPINLYEAGFDASWEIDIFGGNRLKLRAASALVGASEAGRGEVVISLVAEVARNYIEVRNAQNQIAIVNRNMESQQSTVDLTRSQRDAGLASDLETSQAQSQYLTTAARLPTLQSQLEAAQNRLSTLIGEPPGAVDSLLAEIKPVPVLSSAIVLSTPADAIAMRPDVHIAERELAAAIALKGSAISDWYPKLTLSGMFGAQDTSILPSATLWNAATGIAMPVFNFGRIRSMVDAADARQMQAEAAYEKAVLMALEEVETALASYLNEDARRHALEQATESNRQTVALADERYKKGITSFRDVLDAQRELFESESMLAESEASVSKNAVALYKAIGGGVTPPIEVTPSAPPAP